MIITIQNKQQASAAVSPEIAQLRTIADNIRVTTMLIEERFKLREEKAKKLGSKALERHQAMAEGYRKALTEYLSLIDKLPSDGAFSQSSIRNLQALLEKILPKKKRPIIGSLPYKHLNYPAQEPAAAAAITPAYLGGNKTVSPDDTTATHESPISKDIATLAQSLNWNPVSIYEYVKNNTETEWYWGCMKGAEETLHQKSGNDCDQAALLAALLRASGFPTRYVRGTVKFTAAAKDDPLNRIKNLTGIDDPNKIAEFFQKSGIPYTPIIAGGAISNFQIEHVWVESQIPYSNYRGAIIDSMGKTWLGLDTSIKVKGYTYNNAKDIFQETEVSSQLSGIRDQYLGLSSQPTSTQSPTPLEYLQSAINAQLLISQSTATYSDYLHTRTLIPEVLNILPGSMQFILVKATNEYTAIPGELIHQVKFTATDPHKNELFNITLPTYKLSNQQIVMSYEPETVQDQEIIDSYGGLDNTPAYLVHLRPVLKVNDERIIVAQAGVPMGGDFNLAIDLISPNGTKSITNTHIVGNLSVIGISAQRAIMKPQSDPNQQKDAARLLYEEAINYNDRWDKAEDELASLLLVTIARPLPTVVTLGGLIDVTYLLDMPHGFTWKGIFIDANLRAIEAVHRILDPENRTRLFTQLSSLQGSVLENRIFEDDFKVESISTAKLLQFVNSQTISSQLITIDKTNIDAILPTLSFDDYIKEDITNSVNQNFAIRIPQSEMTYEDWSGIGYIKENPSTGESGWMLSGLIAGGMTAWDVDRWNAIVAGTLSNPYSEPANYDPASAQYIQKIASTDMQDGIVGDALDEPLQVKVTDAKKVAVANVLVTFTVKAGGGTFDNMATSVTVSTNGSGIASAPFTLGKYTKTNPTFVWEDGDTYATQAEENIIDAALPSGTNLTMPFTALGLPDAADHLTPLHGNDTWGLQLSFAGFVSAAVEDVYNNPISNATVTFSVADPVQNPDHQCAWTTIDTTHKTYFTETGLACIKNSPTWGTCGDTNKQELVVVTDHYGASAEVILGGMDDANYTVTANAPSLSATFELYTYELISNRANPCDGKGDPYRALMTNYAYTSDLHGNNINAGKTGTTIPVTASMYYDLEKWGWKDVTCGNGTCSKVVGIRQWETSTDFTPDSFMTFGTTAGTSLGGGVYTVPSYTLKPGKNEIKVKGTGTITVKNTHMSCPNGCTTANEPLTETGTATMIVYGVEVKTQPIPLLLVNESGYLSSDQVITYTIEPLSSDYNAITAYTFIYKDDSIIAQIPTETKGTGTATISRGFQIDVNSVYKAEVVLNYGTGMEIRGEKKTLPIGQVKLWTDEAPSTEVVGAVTDDVTTIRIELTVKNGRDTLPQQLNWSIADPQVPDASQEIQGTLLDGDAHVDSLQVDFNSDGVATARYEVPTTFVRFDTDQEANDKTLAERYVQVQLNNSALGLPVIKLKRPPVVLVHGLWSDPGKAWKDFTPKLNNKAQYMISKVDYGISSNAIFSTNFLIVQKIVMRALRDSINDSFAATKVDIIGHSMGGLLARGAGIEAQIHKLITIDTPHNGSELASLLKEVRDRESYLNPEEKIVLYKLRKANCPNNRDTCLNGAIDDLVPGSTALNALPQLGVPRFTVVGLASDGMFGHDPDLVKLWKGLKTVFSKVPDNSFPPCGILGMFTCTAVFSEKNDRIVSRSSQGNGGQGDVMQPAVDHITVTGNQNVVDKVKELLE